MISYLRLVSLIIFLLKKILFTNTTSVINVTHFATIIEQTVEGRDAVNHLKTRICSLSVQLTVIYFLFHLQNMPI